MRFLLKTFFTLCLLQGALAVQAQTAIEVIGLQHRPASEVIPLLQPMIAADEAITGQGYNLIVRVRPDTLAQIHRLLAQIDTPVRQLMVQVRFGQNAEAQNQDASANVRIETGRGTRVSGDAHIVDSRSARQSSQTQQIRVMEGGQAWINSGSAIPYRTVQVVNLPGRVAVVSGQQYFDIGSGFAVRPQLRGQRVWLEINPQQAQVQRTINGQPVIAQQQASTVIEAPLGEWVELAGTGQSSEQQQSGILSTRRRDGQEQNSIWLKVELLEH
ncbi:MAG: hypothetical protein EPO06_01710 [Burkholderiaceae bacterium]|nr:MAG: hypothetical protein EPO06_01710 [Burkholderiaceae bacterium]